MKIAIILCLAAAYEACQIYGGNVSAQDRKTIVNKHNELRQMIVNGQVPGQPQGVNLKRLSWDPQLASAAQRIANSCTFAHQKVDDGRFYVGQNLYLYRSTVFDNKTDWNSAIQSWFDEHKVYKYPDGPSSATGHYTQVVWAKTQLVGCGLTYYKRNAESYFYDKLYVCNYGPAGNYINEAPYETDSRCECGCQNLC